MQVTPDALEQREEPTAPRRRNARDASEPDELAALKTRIAAARTLMPAPHDVHCRDCFAKGRDAAIAAIDGAKD